MTIKDYKRGDLIGRGGYGKVYECSDSHSGASFALKKVKINSSGEEKEVKALKNEIEILSTIQHNRIVQYIGFKQDEKEISIFLEYMPGGSLRQHLDSCGPLSEEPTRKVTEQILEAENILIDGNLNIKLTDFGISKQLEIITSAKGVKTCIGTINWMAPEVLNGEEYGYNADLWSAGCTVVEMLTTKAPFEGCLPCTVIIRVLKSELVGYELPSNSSISLKSFLSILLQQKSADRTSAKQLMQHEFITGRSLQEVSDTNLKCSQTETCLMKDKINTCDNNLLFSENYGNGTFSNENNTSERKCLITEVTSESTAVQSVDEDCLLVETCDNEMLCNERNISEKECFKSDLVLKSVTVESVDKDIDLLFIGKTGNGKSRTGNTILQRDVFKYTDSCTSETQGVQHDYVQYYDRRIKVVDCPGIEVTSNMDDVEKTTSYLIEKMGDAFIKHPCGYDVFLLVVRYGDRFTKEDKCVINTLKSIFGEEKLSRFSFLLMIRGDMFHFQKKNNKIFEKWCSEQTGVLKVLMEECGNLLLYDTTDDKRKIDKQMKKELKLIDNLQRAVKIREHLLLAVKETRILEKTNKECSIIPCELVKLKYNFSYKCL